MPLRFEPEFELAEPTRVDRELELFDDDMATTLLPALVAKLDAAPRTRLKPLPDATVLLKPFASKFSVFFIFSPRMD
jgi:hypothetical protein